MHSLEQLHLEISCLKQIQVCFVLKNNSFNFSGNVSTCNIWRGDILSLICFQRPLFMHIHIWINESYVCVQYNKKVSGFFLCYREKTAVSSCSNQIRKCIRKQSNVGNEETYLFKPDLGQFWQFLSCCKKKKTPMFLTPKRGYKISSEISKGTGLITVMLG